MGLLIWSWIHSIPRLLIGFEENNRGPGYLKFNTALLGDQIFMDHLRQVLVVEIAQPYKYMKQKWELIKLSIRNTTLKYAARKQKSMNNKLLVLEKKLSDNVKLLHQNSIFQDVEEHNLRLRQEINEIMEYKTRGAINM